MKFAFLGDICGRAGRRAVRECIPRIRRLYGVDLILGNAENSAGGMGVTPEIADELLDAGIQVLTSGNHIWQKREIYDYLNRTPELLRPYNYPHGAPGRGWGLFPTGGGGEFLVVNLQGRVFMPPVDCPFQAMEALLGEDIEKESPKIRIVDLHAEATSEKIAMGWFLDGRVSVVLGTHTHVQTADERILPEGTGYITDVGMSGSVNSVLGMKKEGAIRRFVTGLPERLEPAKKNVVVMGIVFEVDESTGKCKHIERFQMSEEEVRKV